MFNRDNALLELKKVELYKTSLLDKYEAMELQMKDAYGVNSSVGKSNVDIRHVHDNNQFIEMLKVHMKNLSTEIAEVEQEYQVKHQTFLDLQLRVKKMELHKELKHQEYIKEYKVKSQKMTDEINSTRQRGKNAKSL